MFYFTFMCLILLNKGALALDQKTDIEGTGMSYMNYVIEPVITGLFNFMENDDEKKSSTAVAKDAALVQAITSVEESLFQLARFFAQQEVSTVRSRFIGGMGIQFSTVLCNNIYSLKFPRERNADLEKPWQFFGDTVYSRVDCSKKKPSRKKRDLKDLQNGKIKKRRVRRDESIERSNCGNISIYTELTGNIRFPAKGDSYSVNLECNWSIQLPSAYAVSVTINDLDLEPSKDCVYDYVAFYEGTELLNRYCSNQSVTLSSSFNKLDIKVVSDFEGTRKGFNLTWNITAAKQVHPGFFTMSTIVVDQVGDLNIDKFQFETLPVGDTFESAVGYKPENDFQLKFNDPTTCTLKSGDSSCYFDTEPYIISKIISTRVYPAFEFKAGSIEVVFDHVVDVKLYEDLVYDAPKSCLVWESNIPSTGFGAWSRKNGQLISTNIEKTVCNFNKPGIYAVAAAVPPPIIPGAFRFSKSWYFGLIYTIFWLFIAFIKLSTSYMNIPEWLNMNQILSLVVFCGILISGMHMELNKTYCSILGFLLYYFGVAFFMWHLLKVAQFTGAFDKFFRRERNLYAFYVMLGWCVPGFIAGMGGGAVFHEREKSQSCWMGIKGDTIVGYATPAYLIILLTCFLYYKGLKKTPFRKKIFNFPKLIKRTIRDIVVLVLSLLTWLTGMFCFINSDRFAPQFFFCLFLCCLAVILSLYSQQQRKTFEKIDDNQDAYSAYEEHKLIIEKNKQKVEMERQKELQLATKYLQKWRQQKPQEKLLVIIRVNGLELATVAFKNGMPFLNLNEKKVENKEPEDVLQNDKEDENEDENEDEGEVVSEAEEGPVNEDEIYTDSEEEEEEEENDYNDGNKEDEEQDKKDSRRSSVKSVNENKDLNDEDDDDNDNDNDVDDDGDEDNDEDNDDDNDVDNDDASDDDNKENGNDKNEDENVTSDVKGIYKKRLSKRISKRRKSEFQLENEERTLLNKDE